ncbi:uncharacterized protein A4U43_C01F7340 [Asparagus officinalis]|uniref:Ankyrin repeat domain-containing protein n=2 Tax=Asparagus officinalis TaxID=4686 RepID=A0A5P1FMK1_ASPOF|nr:uncharacterized protein A4U43_C01F7340 [Asparagus officinalis]
MIIKCHSDPLSQAKLCRRFPRIVASISRIRDFYMEITFHFESSVIPFVGRIFPSDTYRIWKRGSNIRLDMTFAGYDGFRIKRTDQSFLFLGKGKGSEVLPGSLVVLEHKKKEISIALKGPTARGIKPVVVEENARKVAVMSQYISTGKIDVQEAELVPHLNWRRQERTEMIGSWKGKMYDMRNVTVNMKARTVPIKVAHEELSVDHKEDGLDDVMTMEERKQFEAALKMGLEGNYEDFDNGEDSSKEKKSWSGGNNKKASKAIGEKHNGNVKSKKGKEDLIDGKKHKGKNSEKKKKKNGVMDDSDKDKGDGLNIGVTPVLWLTPDFPLKIDELLPLLDVLVNKVKAMRRLRELLAAKLPQGTFPVKVAIPLHTPIVRIVITFTKFEEFSVDSKAKDTKPSGSWYSWARGQFISSSKDETDPFSIPQDYTWIDANERKTRKKANKVKNEQNEVRIQSRQQEILNAYNSWMVSRSKVTQ